MAVELYGGLHDGTVLDIAVSEPMPSPLPDYPGYLPLEPAPNGQPGRWIYRWQVRHTGHRRLCSQKECDPGCPAGRPLRPRPLTPY